MPKLEDLQLQIKQTGAIQATNIGKLAENLERLSAAVKSFPKDATHNLSEINSAIKSINGEKATAVGKIASAIDKLGKKAKDVDVNSAGNIAAIGAAIEQMIDGIDVERLNSISEALKGFRNAIAALNGVKGKAVSPTSVAPVEMPSAADTESGGTIPGGATEQIAETGNAADEATERVSAFRAMLSGVGSSFGDAITSSNAFKTTIKQAALVTVEFGKKLISLPFKPLTSLVGGLGGKVISLFNAFKRIAMYRALRTAIKMITQGFSEGIKHLYQWSELTGNSFKNSMDSLATSAHYLRDSLGAMASPLIDALAPAIDEIVEKFVGLLNVVNQFIATFTGKDTWRKAVKTPTTYSGAMKEAAENTKKATKAQKELNKALQSFDELNVITMNDIKAHKPTSSGGNDGSTISASEFVEVDVDDWIRDIKDKIDQGDWTGLGVYIAGKFNDALEKFDPDEWGGKIADKINDAFDFLDGLINGNEEGDGIHWSKIGIKAAKFTNALFKNINWETVKNVVVGLVDGGLDLVKEFFDTASWDEYALDATKVINGLFNNVTAKKVGDGIASIINAGFKFLKTAVLGGERILQNYDTGETITIWENGLDFQGIGEAIGTTIEEALTGINWKDVGKTLAGIASGLTTIITKAIGKIKVKDIFDALGDLISGFFSDPAAVVNSIELVGIIAGFKLLFGTAIPAALGGLGSVVAAGFSTLFGSPEVTGAIASGVSSGVSEGVTGAGLGSTFGSAMVTFMGTWGLPILGAVGITAGMIALAKKWSEENDNDFKQQSSTPDYKKSIRSMLMDYIVSGKKVQNGDESYLYEMNALQSTIAADTRNKIVLPLADSVDDVSNAIKEAQKWLGEYDTPSGTQTTELDSMSLPSQIEQANTLANLKDTLTKSPWEILISDKDGKMKQAVDRAKAIKEKLDAVKNGTYNPKVTLTTTNLTSTEKKINNVVRNRKTGVSVTFKNYKATKEKLDKLTIDRDLTLKFKPVIEVTDSKGRLKTTPAEMKDLKKLLDAAHYASGGFPEAGQLFYAGENGAVEMAGTVNGRTAVASNQEITGISDAVYETGANESQLLGQLVQIGQQMLAKGNSVTLAPNAAAGRWIAQSQAAYSRATGG